MNVKKLVIKVLKIILTIILVGMCLCQGYYLLQRYWAHKDGYFVPTYERVELTEESDYETIFLQTGLGASAVDKLMKKEGFQAILDAQESFFNPPEVECEELIGWITREDVLGIYENFKKNQYGQYLKDVLDGKYHAGLN